MRPERRFRGPRFSMHNVATKLALAVVVCSLAVGLTAEQLGPWLLLVPSRVLQGLVWQPLSYLFLALDPLGVIFGGIIIWSMGSALEATWGPRRLLVFSLGTGAAAGALTVLLSLLPPFAMLGPAPFTGAKVLTSVLWVAFGLSYGRAITPFWGIPVTGNQLALIGVGFVVLNGVFSRPLFLGVVPELWAVGLTWVFLRGMSPRGLWLRFQNWRLQAKLRGRARHLKLISQNRNTPRDSDRYLQ